MPNYRNQRVVVTDTTQGIAVDRVDDGQRTHRLSCDTGFFDELAHRPLSDGLTQFEDATGKTPATHHRRIGSAHDQNAVVAHYHRQHPDDRPVRVAAALFADRAPAPVRAHSAAALG